MGITWVQSDRRRGALWQHGPESPRSPKFLTLCGGRCRIRTCDPCRVNPSKGTGSGSSPVATSGNHDGHTRANQSNDWLNLAAFWRPLAASLLHEPAVRGSTSWSASLLTVREVARRLRVSTAIVYRLCEIGELAHVRVSSAIRIAPGDLANYVERHTRQR